MKYDSKIFHIIINHITSKSQYHIYIHSSPEKENEDICTTEIH